MADSTHSVDAALDLLTNYWAFLDKWYTAGFGPLMYDWRFLTINDDLLEFAHNHQACGLIHVRGEYGGIYGSVVTGEAKI